MARAPLKTKLTARWDPLTYKHEEPSAQCLLRLKRDIADFCANPPPGLFIAPEEDDVTRIHALVVGPCGTPYEGGFFQFLMKFPQEYPMGLPRVRLMTTDAGRVRFNPHLYASGKVCLSILGTWEGPAWSPAQGMESVLVSIQSMLNEEPYRDEPLLASELVNAGAVTRYNNFIQHETIRVAVCSMVQAALQDSPDCPEVLRKQILKLFSESYCKYERIAENNLYLTGTGMYDFLSPAGVFQYATLLTRLKGLKKMANEKVDADTGHEGDRKPP